MIDREKLFEQLHVILDDKNNVGAQLKILCASGGIITLSVGKEIIEIDYDQDIEDQN